MACNNKPKRSTEYFLFSFIFIQLHVFLILKLTLFSFLLLESNMNSTYGGYDRYVFSNNLLVYCFIYTKDTFKFFKFEFYI